MRIFIAGKYGDHLPESERLMNVQLAVEAARTLLLRGHEPYCPHLSHYIDLGWRRLSAERWYQVQLSWLAVSDGVLMLDNWRESVGATQERAEARRLGIPVYYASEDVPNVTVSGGSM